MKIAILGGSFNPVHKGHLFIAKAVIETLDYDLVILIPAYISPFKQDAADTADGEDALKRQAERRLSLLLSAVEGCRRLTVDDCELLREGVSYTADTVAGIIERYRPDGRPGLIIGDDLAGDFPRWRRAGELAGRCDLIVANRTGAPVGNLPFPYTLLHNAAMPVSSSIVREKMRKGEDWRSFVPERAGAPSIEAAVRGMMPVERFLHSRNVALTACRLAARFAVSEDDAFLAGIAHDMAKEWSTPLEHGKAAAAMLAEQYGVTNGEVLEAVRCHTDGKAGMGALAKIVYIADKIEPRRRIAAARLRDASKTLPLDALFMEVVRETAAYLSRKNVAISENTRELLQGR